MSTVPLTIRVDPVLYQKAAAKARSENCALEQAIVTMLDKWVESEIIYIDEYVVQSGDTLDAIAQAYREKNIKVTVAQILNANPGLKPERMKVGQTIFIPAPQP